MRNEEKLNFTKNTIEKDEDYRVFDLAIDALESEAKSDEQKSETHIEYMKDTNTLIYTNEHQKQHIIDIFSEPCNGGYKLITDDYLESKSLQKGIILKYKEPEVVEGSLTHNIL